MNTASTYLQSIQHNLRRLAGIIVLLSLAACQSTYYNAMESVGIHKRDIMVDRIEDVAEAQTDAKQQFSSALEHFSSIVKVPPTELSDAYEQLNDQYQDSLAAANEISQRIDSVADVSEALFAEWQDELDQYSSASLRRSSQQKLSDTRLKYKRLMQAMRRSEASMEPVLLAMNDQVLYLKHNLNATAISALKNERETIKTDVAKLNQRMQVSINEAQAFVDMLQQ